MTDDLHRTNLNLYASDVDYLQRTFGHGWTEWARDQLHQCVSRKRSNARYLAELGETPYSHLPRDLSKGSSHE